MGKKEVEKAFNGVEFEDDPYCVSDLDIGEIGESGVGGVENDEFISFPFGVIGRLAGGADKVGVGEVAGWLMFNICIIDCKACSITSWEICGGALKFMFWLKFIMGD